MVPYNLHENDGVNFVEPILMLIEHSLDKDDDPLEDRTRVDLEQGVIVVDEVVDLDLFEQTYEVAQNGFVVSVETVQDVVTGLLEACEEDLKVYHALGFVLETLIDDEEDVVLHEVLVVNMGQINRLVLVTDKTEASSFQTVFENAEVNDVTNEDSDRAEIDFDTRSAFVTLPVLVKDISLGSKEAGLTIANLVFLATRIDRKRQVVFFGEVVCAEGSSEAVVFTVCISPVSIVSEVPT